MASKDLDFLTYNSSTGTVIKDWDTEKPLVSGRERLIQNIVKRMLTQRGSNYYNPSFGSQIPAMLAFTSPENESEVRSYLPILIETMVEDIKKEQILQNNLSLSEKLRNINIITIDLDYVFGIWNIVLEVETEDGAVTPLRA